MPSSLASLLHQSLDFAGLFPPKGPFAMIVSFLPRRRLDHARWGAFGLTEAHKTRDKIDET